MNNEIFYRNNGEINEIKIRENNHSFRTNVNIFVDLLQP